MPFKDLLNKKEKPNVQDEEEEPLLGRGESSDLKNKNEDKILKYKKTVKSWMTKRKKMREE